MALYSCGGVAWGFVMFRCGEVEHSVAMSGWSTVGFRDGTVKFSCVMEMRSRVMVMKALYDFSNGERGKYVRERLKAISACCDQMEVIRNARKMPPEELKANGWDLFGCAIGELDMYEEIHRLLYE